jgi:hypothetical protein
VAGRGDGKKKERNGGAHIWRGMEGLRKWRVGGGIWRGMQNGGLFKGPAGDEFLHQTSKFWSRDPYGGPEMLLEFSPISKISQNGSSMILKKGKK